MSISFAEMPVEQDQVSNMTVVPQPNGSRQMLRESAVDSELFGEIELAAMLAVEAAVTSNDEVRDRFPKSVVERATRKVHADTIHCIAESAFYGSKLLTGEYLTATAHSTGKESAPSSYVTATEDPVETLPDDRPDQKYDPFADDEPDDVDADNELIAHALRAETADKIQAAKEKADAEAALRIATEDLHGSGIHLGRRERAFVLAALTDYDPIQAQRQLAEELFVKPDFIEPPSSRIPAPELLVGYDSLQGRIAIRAGYLVARTAATVQRIIHR